MDSNASGKPSLQESPEFATLRARVESLESSLGSGRGDASSPGRIVSSRRSTVAAGFVGVSVILSLVLVLKELIDYSPPGCGSQSACEELANSVWGKVPLVGWPVSFLGFAYFTAVLRLGWVTAFQGIAAPFVALVRFGALLSVGFMVVMLVEGHLCPYCLG